MSNQTHGNECLRVQGRPVVLAAPLHLLDPGLLEDPVAATSDPHPTGIAARWREMLIPRHYTKCLGILLNV